MGQALGDPAPRPEPSPQGVRMDALSDRKGCCPRDQGPRGSHGGSCLAGPQLPSTPLSFQGSFKSPVETVTSQVPRHQPRPSPLASPPSLSHQPGSSKGQCSGHAASAWDGLVDGAGVEGCGAKGWCPQASGARRGNRLSEVLHYCLVSFFKIKDLVYTYMALYLPLRTP